MLKIFLSILFVFLAAGMSAQRSFPLLSPDTSLFRPGTVKNACTNDIILYNLRKDPAFKEKEERMNSAIQYAYRSLGGDTITVPVVVHIINQDPGSITDQQVIDGLQNLNDAYS